MKVYVLIDSAPDGIDIIDIFNKRKDAEIVMEDMLNETMYERFAMKQGRYKYPFTPTFFDTPVIIEKELL